MPEIFQGKSSVFQNFKQEAGWKVARMYRDRGPISCLRMLEQKMGAFLPLLDKALALEKSNDFSCRRHLSTHGNGEGVYSYNFCG